MSTALVLPDVQATGVWLSRLYDLGFTFPDDYLVIDTETTGLEFRDDFIVQFGHLDVRGRYPLAPVARLLSWPNCPKVSQNRFEGQIQRAINELSNYRFSTELLAAHGHDPLVVLEIYYDWFREHQEDKQGYFVMHNGIHFDCPMIEAHFDRFLGRHFRFAPNQVVDTGLIEKAIQLNMYPEPGERMPEFYRRVEHAYGKGTQWRLGDHCMRKYGLDVRYGLDMTAAHTADFDCYITHLLAEEYRAHMDYARRVNVS